MKLKLTKDPSHKGYYVDEEGNLYVFRFGGRPIRVDDYREDKPNDHYTAEKLDVDKEEGIDNRVIFIDNIKHDLAVVLDGESFVWTQVGYDCRPLEKKDV